MAREFLSGATIQSDLAVANALKLEGDVERTDVGDITSATAGWTDNTQISVLRWNGASAGTIHGLASTSDGKLLLVINASATQNLLIANLSTTEATASRRIQTPNAATLTLAPKQGVIFIYDNSGTPRWQILGAPPNVSAGGGRAETANFVVYKTASTYYALKTDDLTVPYSGADAGAVINSALGSALGVYVALEGNTTYTCTTGISIGQNDVLFSSRKTGEGSTYGCVIVAAAGVTGALITLAGSGANLHGIAADGGSIATKTVSVNATGCSVDDCFLRGGTTHTLINEAAQERNRYTNIRAEGDNQPSVSVVEINSTDHFIHGLVATGCGSGGSALIVAGTTNVFGNMHITGNSISGVTMVVSGSQNLFSSVVVDTVATAQLAALVVKSNRNVFAALDIMNAYVGSSMPALALQRPSAGGTCEGNLFMGLVTIKGAQNTNWARLVDFLNESGTTVGTLAAFHGNQIYFAASNCDALTNVTPKAADDIVIRGEILTTATYYTIGSEHVIKEAGTAVTRRTGINFLTGFDLVDDSTNDETDISLDASEVSATPTNQAYGDSAVTGASASFANADHKHGMPAQPVFTIGGSILDPSGARDVMVWRAPFACTVTNVRGHRKGGTGAAINARKNQTSAHLASDLSLTSADAWMDGGAVQNATYAAGDDLEIRLVSIAGAVTEIAIQVDFVRA